MALAQDDLIAIEQLIDQRLAARPELQNSKVHYELELRERTVRVEEELKHQRELMLEGFKQMERRFEQMQLDMNKRFDQVDKRFEQVDKRFEQLTTRMDRFMIWSFATTLTVGGIVIAAIRFLG